MATKSTSKKARGRTKTGAVGVAVIGCGVGRLHLAGYHKLPEARIVAVCDIVKERAEAAAAEVGAAHAIADYHDLLKLEGIDAVSVCVPNHLHEQITVDCLKAGKHVLGEKPLAMNAREGQRMVAAAQRSGKLLMIALCNRFRAEAQYLKGLIAQGELGRMYFGKTGWLRRNGIPRGWFGTMALSGGGPLIDLGVHMLDLTWYLMGKPQPVRASGMTYAEIGSQGKGRGTWGVGFGDDSICDVEDLAVALVRFADGQTIQLEVSWATHVEKEVQFLSLYGTKGGATIEPAFRIFTELGAAPADIAPAIEPVGLFDAETAHFVDCIQGRAEPIAPGEDGLQVARMLDAIYLSAKQGKEVTIGG